MKIQWGLFSLLIHVAISSLLLRKSPEVPAKPTKITSLSEKELKKIISAKLKGQVVKTSKSDQKKVPTLDKIYQSDKNNSAARNTRAKNTGEFKEGDEFQPAPKSITQKGKFNPEKKGKGVSASDDFIEGAEIGPKTIINSQEFKYFSYYDRIRSKVAETWRPLIKKAIKQVKNDPKKYGVLELGLKITKLEIILDANGTVLEINRVGTTGLEPFDLAAEKAFGISGPFAGPPKELVKEGRFVLRWNFTVETKLSGLVEFKTEQAR